jgi:hypothetical protein
VLLPVSGRLTGVAAAAAGVGVLAPLPPAGAAGVVGALAALATGAQLAPRVTVAVLSLFAVPLVVNPLLVLSVPEASPELEFWSFAFSTLRSLLQITFVLFSVLQVTTLFEPGPVLLMLPQVTVSAAATPAIMPIVTADVLIICIILFTISTPYITLCIYLYTMSIIMTSGKL